MYFSSWIIFFKYAVKESINQLVKKHPKIQDCIFAVGLAYGFLNLDIWGCRK